MQNRKATHWVREELKKNEFSHFVKYDEVHGVAVDPDVRITKKNESCFDENYRWNALRHAGARLTFY